MVPTQWLPWWCQPCHFTSRLSLHVTIVTSISLPHLPSKRPLTKKIHRIFHDTDFSANTSGLERTLALVSFDFENSLALQLEAANFAIGSSKSCKWKLQPCIRHLLQVLKPFIDAGMQFQVMVGNEPLASWYNGAYHPILSNCVANMITAIRTEGLSGSVKVTVPFQVGVLSNSYPPSAGGFCSPAPA